MTKKAKVVISLEKSGVDTKLTVRTLQRTTTRPEDEAWVRNLEITSEKVEFEIDEGVAQMLAKGMLMDALADAAVVSLDPAK